MPGDNGLSRLRSFRELAGLTQEALGERLGVTRQTIAAWEKGDRTPTVAQLFSTAQVLAVRPEVLLEPNPDPGGNLLFRADNPGALVPEVRTILSRKAANYAAIEQLLEEPPVLPQSRPAEVYSSHLAEDVARMVRDWLGVEDGPILDVLERLDTQGVKVILYPLPQRISGFSAYTEEWGGVIFVNGNHPLERQHFTALHELGHLMFHRREYAGQTRAAYRADPREKLVQHFAGAVLLPREVLERELRGFANRWLPEPLLFDLKHRFGVSMRTLVIRAAQVGLIPQRLSGQQLGVLNQKYGIDGEPGQLPPAANLTRLDRLVYRALLSEQITVSRAAEVLEAPLASVRMELARWAEAEIQ